MFITCCTLTGILGAVLACWSPLLFAAGLGLAAWKQRHAGRRNRGTHGSARWAGFGDLWSAGCLLHGTTLQLGRAVQLHPASFFQVLRAAFTYPLRLSREVVMLNASRGNKPVPPVLWLPHAVPHVAIYGRSGSGKTTAYSIPNLLAIRHSCLALDPKGELAKITALYRAKKLGHEIVILDPFNVTKGCGLPTASFNPLALYRDNPDRTVDEARRMANALIVRTGEEKEPFWNDAAGVILRDDWRAARPIV